jgi:hypothetical protein
MLPQCFYRMRTNGWRMLLTCLLLLSAGRLGAEPQKSLPEFLDRYCMQCHDAASERGGLNLEALHGKELTAHPAIWEQVVRRLGARQMPPLAEKVRPQEAEYLTQLAGLTSTLDAHGMKSPEPGKVPAMRRLTRTEYQNAIRDLLGLEVDVSELLPKDESSHGFDNITVGSLSPTLLNRYLSAAQKISRLAVGGDQSAQVRVVRVPADRTQEEHVGGLPLGTRGGILFEHTFPVAGEYEVEIRLTRDRNEEVEGLKEAHQLVVLFDGMQRKEFTVKPAKGNDHTKVDADLQARIQVPEGAHKIGVTFVRKSSALLETKRQPYDAAFNVHRHPRQAPAVFQVSLAGPFSIQPTGSKTASQERIFVKQPSSPDDETDCAETIIRTLLQRAYRRPVTPADMAGPMEFYRDGRSAGNFAAGITNALSAILVSPRFLFRVEQDPPDLAAGTVYHLDDLTLASRLSFFLWSSLPDDELRSQAAAGKLSDQIVLTQQVKRMLADPKALALVTNFANQWLQLRNLQSVAPDLRLFPDFDDNLRTAFRQETELFFESIFREDRSVVDLLQADYTFLNERLAKHYGIPHVQGSRFRRVKLTERDHRGGLLRQGSILTVTSYANRTSPVIRGNWILDNILGTPTPPPPPNIPALDDAVVDSTLPMRQRLAVHREKQSCAVCHNLMDPVGFSLENYDATGRWRNNEGEGSVDASGGLPDGQLFQGVSGLERGLLIRPELFARTVTEKLLTYALGRGLDSGDAPAVRKILSDAAPHYRLSSLILGIAKSLPFTHRKSS